MPPSLGKSSDSTGTEGLRMLRVFLAVPGPRTGCALPARRGRHQGNLERREGFSLPAVPAVVEGKRTRVKVRWDFPPPSSEKSGHGSAGRAQGARECGRGCNASSAQRRIRGASTGNAGQENPPVCHGREQAQLGAGSNGKEQFGKRFDQLPSNTAWNAFPLPSVEGQLFTELLEKLSDNKPRFFPTCLQLDDRKYKAIRSTCPLFTVPWCGPYPCCDSEGGGAGTAAPGRAKLGLLQSPLEQQLLGSGVTERWGLSDHGCSSDLADRTSLGSSSPSQPQQQPTGSCHPLLPRNPAVKCGNIQYAPALQSPTADD
ncbi:uncharacterized protein LOC127468535 [Manacus candei]|uniref:uncharacterized protein LOC127468535 n=1 Tax=Manacus candei TaxID=415023 RepID=UPI002227ADDC|nr:uncharacterized protein LOC127468535 [Manacus candei]XP_051637764.1 uncharacterized protein LOC127468535 [Manacus candei]XP_051637765.1 uncharacterized protein LOC127468535 [Manacus candei]